MACCRITTSTKPTWMLCVYEHRLAEPVQALPPLSRIGCRPLATGGFIFNSREITHQSHPAHAMSRHSQRFSIWFLWLLTTLVILPLSEAKEYCYYDKYVSSSSVRVPCSHLVG